MCLQARTNVLKAKKPITVYKLLRGDATAPYRRTKYFRGELKHVANFSGSAEIKNYKQGDRCVGHNIERGLHTFTSLRKAKKEVKWISRRIVVQCTIPKGTLYIRGINGEIVSLKLKVGKAVWATGLYASAGLIRQFNKIRKRKR